MTEGNRTVNIIKTVRQTLFRTVNILIIMNYALIYLPEVG